MQNIRLGDESGEDRVYFELEKDFKQNNGVHKWTIERYSVPLDLVDSDGTYFSKKNLQFIKDFALLNTK